MSIVILQLIKNIVRIKQANRFPSYIDYIQFPFFRNIELDQRINFDFPLTAFIGPNGSGKSSTLHAIYGCPEGKTPYEFWFSSEVDPIEYQLKSRGLRQSFFYGFKDENNNELQVVKARIRRRNNPNYWETSRPILSYGMVKPPNDRERNEPIKKQVIYFDFRSELSAFDKYFYFETPPSNLVNNKKQEYIRYKSRILRNLFNEAYPIANNNYGHPLNERMQTLSDEEQFAISEILGTNYTNIKIIYHRLFHNWGFSIRLTTKFHNYTEAFAGSGETSVVRLVHEVAHAEKGSLILLDEPEVSLHPAAQRKLLIYLLNQIKKKKHQIVISTHSPNLIDGLPRDAIKVFTKKIDTGKSIIKENISHEEAFFFIGQEITEKITIIVEDLLAKKIIESALKLLGEEVNNRFVVKYLPGGAGSIQQQISVYTNTNEKRIFFIFDGDQKRVDDLFDVSILSDVNKNMKYLKERIMEQTGVKIKFYPDGEADGANEEQLIQLMISFLKYYKDHVYYAPEQTPEDIIWEDNTIQKLFNEIDYKNNFERINQLDSSKSKIYEASKIFFGDSKQVEAFETLLIKEWITKQDENFKQLRNIILNIEEFIDNQIQD